MAAIDDLIAQITDDSLRERIRAEIKRANKQKKFGLVYEEHLPESTPLYDVPVKKGSIVLVCWSVTQGLEKQRFCRFCAINRILKQVVFCF